MQHRHWEFDQTCQTLQIKRGANTPAVRKQSKPVVDAAPSWFDNKASAFDLQLLTSRCSMYLSAKWKSRKWGCLNFKHRVLMQVVIQLHSLHDHTRFLAPSIKWERMKKKQQQAKATSRTHVFPPLRKQPHPLPKAYLSPPLHHPAQWHQ